MHNPEQKSKHHYSLEEFKAMLPDSSCFEEVEDPNDPRKIFIVIKNEENFENIRCLIQMCQLMRINVIDFQSCTVDVRKKRIRLARTSSILLSFCLNDITTPGGFLFRLNKLAYQTDTGFMFMRQDEKLIAQRAPHITRVFGSKATPADIKKLFKLLSQLPKPIAPFFDLYQGVGWSYNQYDAQAGEIISDAFLTFSSGWPMTITLNGRSCNQLLEDISSVLKTIDDVMHVSPDSSEYERVSPTTLTLEEKLKEHHLIHHLQAELSDILFQEHKDEEKRLKSLRPFEILSQQYEDEEKRLKILRPFEERCREIRFKTQEGNSFLNLVKQTHEQLVNTRDSLIKLKGVEFRRGLLEARTHDILPSKSSIHQLISDIKGLRNDINKIDPQRKIKLISAQKDELLKRPWKVMNLLLHEYLQQVIYAPPELDLKKEDDALSELLILENFAEHQLEDKELKAQIYIYKLPREFINRYGQEISELDELDWKNEAKFQSAITEIAKWSTEYTQRVTSISKEKRSEHSEQPAIQPLWEHYGKLFKAFDSLKRIELEIKTLAEHKLEDEKQLISFLESHRKIHNELENILALKLEHPVWINEYIAGLSKKNDTISEKCKKRLQTQLGARYRLCPLPKAADAAAIEFLDFLFRK